MTENLGKDPLSYMGATGATQAQVSEGTRDDVYISPLTLNLDAATTTNTGVVRLATNAETTTGTATDIATTPAGVAAVAIAGATDATTTTKGITELATDGECTSRSATTPLAVQPSNLTAVMSSPGPIGDDNADTGEFTDLSATGTFALTGDQVQVTEGGTGLAACATGDLLLGDGANSLAVLNIGATPRQLLQVNAGGTTAEWTSNVDVPGTLDVTGAATFDGTVTINGAMTFDDSVTVTGALTVDGLLTANASAIIETAGATLSLAADNSGDAVILGGGTTIRAITIGQDAAAHTIAIGQAAAGAITIDTAAGVSIDAAAASNFTVAGAGIDLSLISGAGRVIVNGEEAAANAITLLSAAGGIDADAALQINIDSSQVAADAIRIFASDAAGGIDMDSGTGGTAIDSTGAISLDGAAASNFSVSGAGIDLSMISTGGRVIVNGEEAAANAVTLLSAAGGIDADAALQINLTSSQAAVADSVRIFASAADGGIDIDSGTGGMTLDTTGAMSLNGAAASDFTVTGAFDLTLASSAGSVVVNAAEAVEDAILLNASNAAGGITIQTGGGDITVTGTVKEISAEFLEASGDEITAFSLSPLLTTAADTAGVATGANGDVNLMYCQQGVLMEQFIIGTQTIIGPRMDSNGLLVSLDLTAAEGAEYNFGAALTNSRHAFTIGTSDAFFFEVGLRINDMDGADPYVIGFRKSEANNATLASYTDYACIGMLASSSATNILTIDELNSGGQTVTNTTDAWGGDGTTNTLRVLVSAAGVVTYTVNGSAPSAAGAFTFDNGDVVCPFIHLLHSASATEVNITSLKVGFQA